MKTEILADEMTRYPRCTLKCSTEKKYVGGGGEGRLAKFCFSWMLGTQEWIVFFSFEMSLKCFE